MQQKRLVKLLVVLLSSVIAGVCLQAPISVLAQVHIPEWALVIKAWKELLLVCAAVVLLVLVWQENAWSRLFRDKLLWLCGVIVVLHGVVWLGFPNNPLGEVAALVIDTRYYILFILCYSTVALWPYTRRWLLVAAAAGCMIVFIFALLQVTVLPKETLQYIGYSKETIAPYLTVDQNHDFIRISSTLRGPNPLGALAVLFLSVVAVAVLRGVRVEGRRVWLIFATVAGAIAALWFSYSRSAWIAALVAVGGMVVGTGGWRKLSRRSVGVITMCGVILAVACVLVVNLHFVQHVIFHTNPASTTVTKSDGEHASSLSSGIAISAAKPFGLGLGSVGSPSLLTETPRIIENQYLYMAIESGWIGLVLQLGVFSWVLFALWRVRQYWLALGVFTAGLGMAVIGLVLPVWADDTVSLLWWGLAGLAIGNKPPTKKEMFYA